MCSASCAPALRCDGDMLPPDVRPRMPGAQWRVSPTGATRMRPSPLTALAPTPRAAVEQLRRSAAVPAGPGDHFHGWGVMGLTFASGHVLGLRRWEASSLGTPYAAVWHRDPGGRWRVISDVAADLSCARYISALTSESQVLPIALTWEADDALEVRVDGIGLRWRLTFASHPLFVGYAGFAALAPAAAVRSAPARWMLERVGAPLLGAGRIRLAGRMPNGQRYRLLPERMWLVATSEATLHGRALGVPEPPMRPVRLGEFIVPERGILAMARASFDCP